MAYHLHDITEIEGIGPSRAAILRRRGLLSTEDLLRFSPGALIRKVERLAGFPANRMGEYRAQAQLLQVEGLGPQIAEALCALRRRSLGMLAAPHPRDLVAELARAAVPGVPDEEVVLRWQKRAIAIESSAKLAGIVLDERQQPVAGAEVRVGCESALTGPNGRFWLPVVAHGRVRVHVTAAGFRRFTQVVASAASDIPLRVFPLAPATEALAREELDESTGGVLRRLSSADQRRWVPTEVSALPEGAAVWFSRRFEDGRAVLHGAKRKKVGTEIQIPKVVVPGDWVPAGTAAGTVFHWRGGRLERSGETLVSLRMSQWLGPMARFFAVEG